MPKKHSISFEKKNFFPLLVNFVTLSPAAHTSYYYQVDDIIAKENNRRRGESYPDPYRLIYVDSNKLEYYLLNSDQTDYHYAEEIEDDIVDLYQSERARFRRKASLGRIIGGEWDKHKQGFESHNLYTSLRRIYKEDASWTDTGFIQICLKRIQRGYNSYGYSTKKDFLENRITYIDSLYNDIEESGYKTQKQVTNDRRNKNLFHGVTVNIGRYGELIFNNETGQHRLSLAKILDIPKIPVLVVVRHEQWQNIRHETHKNGLPDKYKKLRDHPDLQDILN